MKVSDEFAAANFIKVPHHFSQLLQGIGLNLKPSKHWNGFVPFDFFDYQEMSIMDW